MLAGLPAVFLFVFGNRFFCSYFFETLAATALVTLGVGYMIRKSKHQKKIWAAMGVLLLASYAQVRFFYPYADRCLSKSPVHQTSVRMQEILKVLENFKSDCGFYPSSEQGLLALTMPPKDSQMCPRWGESSSRSKGEAYLDGLPADAWDKVYKYELASEPVLTSFGEDGRPGGTGADQDISSREL